jgi:hypothetical protein
MARQGDIPRDDSHVRRDYIEYYYNYCWQRSYLDHVSPVEYQLIAA